VPSANDRLKGVQAKVERAKHHVQDLNGALQTFFDSKPYVVGTKRNPQTRQLIYYVVSVREGPAIVNVIAGEVLQSLRSALDHLAYQLVLVGTGQPGPFNHVYFPIFNSAQEYEAEKLRQIKGMRKKAIDAIDAVKPYKGGNETLWRLHKLNIVDKHRLLVTVGSRVRSVDLGALVSSRMKLPDGTPVPKMSAFFRAASDDPMVPLKAGDEVFIDGPDAEPKQDFEIRFEVALSEPGILAGEPVIETLHQMVDLVDHLVPTFRPLL